MTKKKESVEKVQEAVQETEKKEKKIVATFDSFQGTCRRFTVGELGDDISGALYVKNSAEVPQEIKIIFKGE